MQSQYQDCGELRRNEAGRSISRLQSFIVNLNLLISPIVPFNIGVPINYIHISDSSERDWSLSLQDLTDRTHLSSCPNSVVRLNSHEVAGVVLHDGDLAGGGAVPAADLQHSVRGQDELPDSPDGLSLHPAPGRREVLCEEVAAVLGNTAR